MIKQCYNALLDQTELTHPAEDQKCYQNYHQSDYCKTTDLEEGSQVEDSQEKEDSQMAEEDTLDVEDTPVEEEDLPELDPQEEDGDHHHLRCPLQANHGKLVGETPTNFDGDRKQMQLFINKWELYWGVNNDNPLMVNPY